MKKNRMFGVNYISSAYSQQKTSNIDRPTQMTGLSLLQDTSEATLIISTTSYSLQPLQELQYTGPRDDWV